MASRNIMRHRAAGRESGAAGRHSGVAGDAVVRPEDVAEQRKASGVAGTCSSAAEDVAVRRMPRGMLSGLGKTLRNVAGWAVEVPAARGCCEKAGRRRDHGGRRCGRQVWRWKTSHEAEDKSGGGRHIGRRRMHLEAEDASEGGRRVGSRSRV